SLQRHDVLPLSLTTMRGPLRAYLTPPNVSPWMMKRWMKRDAMTSGRMASTTPAETLAICTPFEVWSAASETGIVAVCGPLSTSANRNSFHDRMKPSTPAAAMPGSDTGTTMRQIALQAVAPSVLAAHSMSTGSPSKTLIRLQVRYCRCNADYMWTMSSSDTVSS